MLLSNRRAQQVSVEGARVLQDEGHGQCGAGVEIRAYVWV